MTAQNDVQRRLEELVITQLGGSLTPEEQQELAALRTRHPDYDFEALERAAAALHLALLPGLEPLPAAMRSRLLALNPGATAPSPVRRRLPRAFDWTADPLRYAGWVVAAALAVVGGTLLLRQQSPGQIETSARVPAARTQVQVPPPAQVPAAPMPKTAPATRSDAAVDPALARAQLLKSGQPLLQRAWIAGPDPSAIGLTGDVVWDPKTQSGFMAFKGLRPNNPMVAQYQLWIFDGQRDERYPVDGGVFDITAHAGTQVVPIRVPLTITTAIRFVVTLEPPGGVVVSDRAHIVAIASTS